MKKVMISQPMRGKSETQIRAERRHIIEYLNAKGYEVVDTVFPDFSDVRNIPLRYLAKSIEALVGVDLVYFMDGWSSARGCRIEQQCCVEYGIPYEVEGALEVV